MQNSCAHYWRYARPILYAGRDAGAPSAHIIGFMRVRCSTPAGTPAPPSAKSSILCPMPQVMQNSCAHYWLYAHPLLYAGRDAGAPSAHIIGFMRGCCSAPAGTPALPVAPPCQDFGTVRDIWAVREPHFQGFAGKAPALSDAFQWVRLVHEFSDFALI